jgi:two-component sensor histidine kinase
MQRVVKTIAKCFLNGDAWEDTFPLRGKDGEYRWFLSRALPARNKKGRVVRWFGTNTDITERLRAEQNREFLVNELNHRVKNTLAIVQGMARQTFRDSGDTGRALARTFENRLAALAAAHNLLTRSNWESSSLGELALESIKSGCAREAAVHIHGPPVVLTPKQAITFVMAFHELCTNATKYGALSSASGRIDIRWTVSDGPDGRQLKLIWRERGGPAVTPPRRRGFGLRMIEQALARELDGRATLQFRPDGLVCTIEGTLERNGRSAA